MASPFAKYQSEQVQQIAPGFVEGFGRAGASIGQGIAGAGAAIAQGIEKSEQVKKEEAKQQAVIGTYLKRDPRIQGINKHLAEGDLQKDDKGNVFVPDDRREMFDTVKLDEALTYYNQTGGDGSKLSGAALTKFTTEFEAEKKYEADQAAKVQASLEQRKLLADIGKTEAEAAEKYARAGIGATIGAFGAGMDMSRWRAPMAPTPPTMAGGATAPQPPATAGFSVLTGAPSRTPAAEPRPGTVTPQGVVAGRPLTTTLGTAPTAPAVATTPVPVSVTPPASVPATASAAMPTNTTTQTTSQAYLTEIPKLQQARIALDQSWQKEMGVFTANHQIALARLTAQGATPEEIKALGETANTMYKLKADRYASNIATLDSRLAGFQKAADEARAAEKAAQGAKAEGRADAGEQRTKTEFDVKFGVEGKPAPKGKFATFWQKTEAEREQSGIIPGRTGGTMAVEMRRANKEAHDKNMKDYPAWYQVGLTTQGANQYRLRMVEPTAEPISESVRNDAQTVVEGYTEGRVFLTGLLEAVQSTDDDRVRNYLDRFLATTSKDDVWAEGQQLGQFGVAAFRRAIVSGGNFSDADREYVAQLITQINTPNVFANKDVLLAQTKKLASFIDAKFRSTLAAKGITLDLKASEEFLKREDRDGSSSQDLANLEKTKEFYKAYKIDPAKNTTPSRPNVILDVVEVRKQVEKARKAGNQRLVDLLEHTLKQNAEDKAKAAREAAAAAARARGA
jgi:hypothetical protein